MAGTNTQNYASAPDTPQLNAADSSNSSFNLNVSNNEDCNRPPCIGEISVTQNHPVADFEAADINSGKYKYKYYKGHTYKLTSRYKSFIVPFR